MTVEIKGTLSFALDTCIQREREAGILKISQRAYIDNILKDFFPKGSKAKRDPRFPRGAL